jgi:transposase InsO family protein
MYPIRERGITSSCSLTTGCGQRVPARRLPGQRVAESFFASLKLELVYQVQWRTHAEVRTAIFDYLELFYKHRRRHSSLGYLSPVEFERRNQRRLPGQPDA